MQNTCYVIGGSSQIGSWLVPELVLKGWKIHLISRGIRSKGGQGSGTVWHKFDLLDSNSRLPPDEARVVFHTYGIQFLPPLLQEFRSRGVTRVIAFSSTSRFTKTSSDNTVDLKVVRNLELDEQAVIDTCERLGMQWTIFRPTMIYAGMHGDRNVMDIAQVINRVWFFPLFGNGKGLRQPVHAADLAVACVQACDEESTFNKSYNLAGGEVLTYREMVERIFSLLNLKPRFIRTPIWCFELAVFFVRKIPRYDHITTSMAKRMQQDMIFSTAEAAADFGYQPRKFLPKL